MNHTIFQIILCLQNRACIYKEPDKIEADMNVVCFVQTE